METAWTRCRKAWGAIRGGYEGVEPFGKLISTRGMDPKAWCKSAREWSSERNSKMAGMDESFRQGLELIQKLNEMDAIKKKSVTQIEAESYESFGEKRLASAIESLEKPSQNFAKQEALLHAHWARACGEPLNPRALESSVLGVLRSSWWEVGRDWALELGVLAQEQFKKGVWDLDEEGMLSMCETAAMVGSRYLTELEMEEREDVNGRWSHAWLACCDWPWPEKGLGGEIVEWMRRKWSEGRFSNAKIAERFEELPISPSWDQMMMAKIAADSIFATTPSRENGLARLDSMFMSRREYWALERAVLEEPPRVVDRASEAVKVKRL